MSCSNGSRHKPRSIACLRETSRKRPSLITTPPCTAMSEGDPLVTALLEREPTLVEFSLNGQAVSARSDETIIQAAKRHGVDIPHLCYKEGYRPDGNCRACVVEIKGERVLAPSCCRQPAKGMEVGSNTERAVHSQKMVVELLMSDVPKEDLKPGANELFQWAGELGVTRSRFAPRSQPAPHVSHPP